MKIGHFCLFRIIPVISHLIRILLIAFILASSSNFNDLFDLSPELILTRSPRIESVCFLCVNR